MPILEYRSNPSDPDKTEKARVAKSIERDKEAHAKSLKEDPTQKIISEQNKQAQLKRHFGNENKNEVAEAEAEEHRELDKELAKSQTAEEKAKRELEK